MIDDANEQAADPDHEARQRLQAAKLERARITEARTAREKARSVSEQLAEAERELRDDQAIEKAECEHGLLGSKLAAVKSGLGVVIVKRPHHVLFRRFQDAGKTDSVQLSILVNGCLVHPDLGTFERYCEEEPALLLRVANAVAALAGVRASEVSGK